MSEFINPILIKDSRIDNITDKIGYGVFQGGANISYYSYPAVSSGDNQLIFNCPIPSLHTLIDRNALITATYKIKLTISNVPVGASSFDYGIGECFQAFPIHSSFLNTTLQINNTTTTINIQNCLQALLRLIEPRDIQRYNGMSPTLPDLYFNSYTDAIGSKADITGDYRASSFDNYLLPRGSHPLDNINVVHKLAGGGGTDANLISTNINDEWIITLTSTFTEPLIISPFLFGSRNDYNNQALAGIENINLTCNLDTSLKRFFTFSGNHTVSIKFDETDPITNAKLLFNFLTVQETDKIPLRNIVNYVDYPIFISNDLNILNSGNQTTFISQNIKLNQIPDLFIVFVRRPIENTTIKHTNSFLPIRKVNISFNNQSGLLSTATPMDLWRLSKINGSTQNWLEFWGYANKMNMNKGVDVVNLNEYIISTSGSILIINPIKDLSQDYKFSNGSIGEFNFQIKLDVVNNTPDNFIPQLCVITANSGVLVNDDGITNIYTGLLTKSLINEAIGIQQGVPSASYSRLTGGNVKTSKLDDLLQ